MNHEAIDHHGWRRHHAVGHDLLQLLDLHEIDGDTLVARGVLDQLNRAPAATDDAG
jgi:hypothetical protein